MATVIVTKHKKTCPTCSKEFFAPRSAYKFCSRTCSSHSIAKHIDSKPQIYSINCANCQSPVTVREFYAKGLERRGGKRPKYCSRTCYQESVRNREMPSESSCSTCKVKLPFTIEFFSKNSHKSSVFGLNKQCKKCVAALAKEPNKRAQRKIRVQVLTEYGNGKLACVCCGVSEHEFLTLDHIFGDGAAERRSSNNGKRRSSNQNIFTRLRREGFPKGRYRTLCMNCNHARGKYGYCPHQNKPS